MPAMGSHPSASAAELRSRLEADFRQRVTLFYRSLQITPPYHSVEKALQTLRDRLKSLPEPDLRAAAADPASTDSFFGQAFLESGLAKKSRGIITKVMADRPELCPPECQPFGNAFKGPS